MLTCTYQGERKVELTDKPMPKASPGSAVVRIKAASICGTDVRTYTYGNQKIKPGITMGHEACGIITELGKGIKGFRKGERVMAAPAIGCGECHACRHGWYNLCDSLRTIGFQYDGTFAEYMEIPAEAFARGNVIRVPKNLSDEEAALIEPLACIVNAQEFLNIQQGDFVAIFGSGFIGCMHAQLALSKGAEKVVMIDLSKNRLDEVKSVVDEVLTIDLSSVDLTEQITKISGGRGMDVIITACSSGKAQMDAQAISAKHGRISLFGGLPGESKGFIDSNLVHYKELSIFGVHASTPRHNEMAAKLIAKGAFNLKQFTRNTYPLAKAQEAFEDMRTQKIMKAILKP